MRLGTKSEVVGISWITAPDKPGVLEKQVEYSSSKDSSSVR
jgi:hypothetical protein